MSHTATEWAIQQKGLKPASRIVLFCLADRHNPDLGCFPSHKRLAEDAEMSERSVRDHLAHLEKAGLIRRDAGQRRAGEFAATRYILAFEADFGDQRQILPTAKSADGKSCQRQNGVADRRQNLPTNLVRGTSKKPRDERAVLEALCAVLSEGVAEDFIAHRKGKRAKLTARAAELIVGNLRGMARADADAAALRSIAMGWTGIFPENTGAAPRDVKPPPDSLEAKRARWAKIRGAEDPTPAVPPRRPV